MSKRSRRIAMLTQAKKKEHRFPRPNKRLAKAFRIALDPYRKREYGYDGSIVPHANWPVCGFVCPACRIAKDVAWHFWITPSIAVCQECAMSLLDGEIQDHDIAQEFNFYTGKHDCVSCSGCALKAAMDEEKSDGT